MSINIKSLKKACDELNIEYKIYDKDSLFVGVKINNKEYFFIQNQVPLSSQTETRICSDKEYTYLLLKDKVNMPKTIGFLDPNVTEQFKEYLHDSDYKIIKQKILKEFKLPVILKRNRGSTGNNVFSCESEDQIIPTIQKIFNKQSLDYDYVMLAQQKIEIREEYRVITLQGKIQFAYIKDNSKAQFTGNLSPLHWEGAEAILLNDQDDRIVQLQKFVDNIYSSFKIDYSGLDIALDKNGMHWLIEINSHPAFAFFIKDNGDEKVVGLYKNILKLLSE